MYAFLIAFAFLVAVPALSAEADVGTTPQQGDGPTEKIHRAALAWIDECLAKNKTDELVPLAEAIADKLIAGGKFYAAGDPGFCEELDFRAGGFANTTVWTNQRMTGNDVLILGLLSQNDKASRLFPLGVIAQGYGQYTQALTVIIGSMKWPQFSRLSEVVDKKRWPAGIYFLDTGAPDANTFEAAALGQMNTVALATALEGEIVAAASRKGKTLAMLASIAAPGGEEFDKKLKDKSFVDEPKIEAIPAGKLAKEYLAQCRKQLAAFLSSGQADKLREAAKRLADCQKRGGVIWTVADGHMFTRGNQIPGELTHLYFYGRSWQWDAPKGVKAGDTLLHIGYLDFPKDEVEACLKAGTDAVVTTVNPGAPNAAVTWVGTCWEKWDAVVEVPGYPYKILASSGTVQTPQWYSLMAETVKLLGEPAAK